MKTWLIGIGADDTTTTTSEIVIDIPPRRHFVDFFFQGWVNKVDNSTKRIDYIVNNGVYYIHKFWYCSEC